MAKRPKVYDFPAVSEQTEAKRSLEDADPGATVVFDETVYEWVGPGTYDRGEEPIGTVTIVHWKSTTGQRVPFTAHFELDNGETVSLSGFVPGGVSWVGKGLVAYAGGTGKFAGRSGQLPLESNNPKRWG